MLLLLLLLLLVAPPTTSSKSIRHDPTPQARHGFHPHTCVRLCPPRSRRGGPSWCAKKDVDQEWAGDRSRLEGGLGVFFKEQEHMCC